MQRLVIAFVLSLLTLNAYAVDFAIGAGGGTPGLGLSATLGVTQNVNVRGLLNFFEYDFDENEEGIDYELDLDLNSIGALVDWHPMGGAFRISGGLFSNGNEVSGTGRGQAGTTVEFGDMVFDADDLGTVDASIDFESVAPYLGFGWGNAVGEGNWSFNVDLGVFFQGAPEVSLLTPEVDPLIAPLVDAERARAQAELEDETDNLEFYPYLSFGVGFKL